jgi:tetratricopeptide (TPR) repeat protein
MNSKNQNNAEPVLSLEELNRVDKLIRKSDKLAEKGKFGEALIVLQQISEIGDNIPIVFFEMGNILLDMERYDEAVAMFERLIHLEYHSPIAHTVQDAETDMVMDLKTAAHYNKGNALYLQEKYKEAIDAYTRAIEIETDYYTAWFNRACMYTKLGNNEQALKDLKQAIKLNKKFKKEARQEEFFESLLKDPEFIKITK